MQIKNLTRSFFYFDGNITEALEEYVVKHHGVTFDGDLIIEDEQGLWFISPGEYIVKSDDVIIGACDASGFAEYSLYAAQIEVAR